MRSLNVGGIRRDSAPSALPADEPGAASAASTATLRDAIRRRYGEWQAPGARYAALARMSLMRAARKAAGGRGDD